ncbi:thymus-specific serine protease [Pelomyxa schiedti]|nr:thymus-specific serine protease [Pelomyxa schiedti]
MAWGLVAAVVVCVCVGLSEGIVVGLGNYGRQRSLAREWLGVDQSTILWFQNQRVDHFDNTNTALWKQRYLLNDTYWGGNGYPIILNIGGEGMLAPNAASGRFIFNDWAQELSALIVSIEHRYYGLSIPTGDISDKSLRFLSSEQALADYVEFVSYIKSMYQAPDSKVLAVGGSYSGALSVWVRQKYPQSIHCSYGTSAPVLAQENFPEFFEVVGQGLGEECSTAVNQGTKYYEALLNSEEGCKQIEQDFNTCTPIETENDKITFLSYLADSISGFVQYNNDNNGVLPTNITGICDILLSGPISQTFPQFIQYYNTEYNEACTPVSYNDMVGDLKNAHAGLPEGSGRSWWWQTCTEFGYFSTGDSSQQPFSSLISLDYYTGICRDVFNISSEAIANAVEATNTLYGGRNVGSTETVFPNGSVDPWHTLGITSSSDPLLPAVYIQGTAHCADLYAASPNDIPALIAARQQLFTYAVDEVAATDSFSSSSSGGPEKLAYMSGITIPLSCVSMVCCTLVFISLMKTRDFLIPPYFGVWNLSISDFSMALGTVLAEVTASDGACHTAAFLTQTAVLAGNFWLVFICLSLFYLYRSHVVTLLKGESNIFLEGERISVPKISVLHVIAASTVWVLAITSAFIPLTEVNGIRYGKGPIGTCWIAIRPLMGRFFLFYLPLCIALLVVVIIYWVIVKLHSLLGSGYYTPRQFLYPVTTLIVIVPCCINMLFESTDQIIPATEYTQAVVLPLWGFIDSTVYFLTRYTGAPSSMTIWELFFKPLPKPS